MRIIRNPLMKHTTRKIAASPAQHFDFKGRWDPRNDVKDLIIVVESRLNNMPRLAENDILALIL